MPNLGWFRDNTVAIFAGVEAGSELRVRLTGLG
jgi:hypothetical protein